MKKLIFIFIAGIFIFSCRKEKDIANYTGLSGNSNPQPENSFYMEGNGHHHELIVIDTSSSSGSWNTTLGRFIINQAGFTHSNHHTISFSFILSDSIPGNYTLGMQNNYGHLQLHNDTSTESYTSQLMTSVAFCTLTKVEEPGGRVKATFHGVLFPDSSGSSTVVISNGKINVTRIQ